MTHLVHNEYRKFKKSLGDLLSNRIVSKLTSEQREEVYRNVLDSLFGSSSGTEIAFEDRFSNVDKVYHFDLMKETLIKIGKSISEKFKQLDSLENDDKEIKLIQVLNDTIDHPITLPYLIPNLCECTLSSIEFLFRHLNSGQKVFEVKIDKKLDDKLDKKLIDKINTKNDKKINISLSGKDRKSNEERPKCETDPKKFYKIYSSNKTSEYYESKKTSRRIESRAESWNESEKKLLGERIDAIAFESSKLYQLNQQYRRNKEEMQDELVMWKGKYHRLVHELEEKTMMIDEKQIEFEGLELELNAIKVQLESIYKQNQLLDSDKSNLSNNASNLQRKILEIETQNNASKAECSKLKQIIVKQEQQIECLKKEFDEKKANFEQIHLKKLIEEEQAHKRRLEHVENQENDIKLKYEKIINEFESKQTNLDHESRNLRQEIEMMKTRYDEKVDENFKLTLELKEHNLRIENLKRDKQDNDEFLKRCRDEQSLLLKKLDQSAQETNRIKKLHQESFELIERKTTENEQLQCDLSVLRNENVELAGKLLSLKNENIKQLELTKKLFANEMKEKSKLIDELNKSLSDLKKKHMCANEEKEILIKLFKYIENIPNPNQPLPQCLDDEFVTQNRQSLRFEHYLDLIKEMKNEFKSKEHEINRLKESTKLVESEYEEQKHFLNIIQQKLNSTSSQLKIKDCELVHLRDELAECKVQKNENELAKMNAMKENENLKSEKSSLELLKIELKQQITNYQLRIVELENELQINVNKVVELHKQTNELNEKYQQVNDELKCIVEQMSESSNARDQLERELGSVKQEVKKIGESYENEKEINSNLNQIHQQSLEEQSRLEKELNQFKSDNQQLESDLDKIENEFKDYEMRYKKLIDDRSLLIDLVTKYNLILKAHLSTSLEADEMCFEFASNNRTNLKLIQPDFLIQVLLSVQNEQSNFRRQIESLKMQLAEQKMKVRQQADMNSQYKSMIEHNENSLLTKKMNYEKLFKEQRDFKAQFEQTLEENEKLRVEKSYLAERVLSLDRILETTREFVERKFAETNGDKLTNDQKWKCSLEQYLNQIDRRNETGLEDLEVRLVHMHDSLTEFINILVRNIGEHKERTDELDKMNKVLNDRLGEMSNLLAKCRDGEMGLQVENENLKKELIVSNHNSQEIENRAKQLTNQINDLQDECRTLQNSLESNRLTMNDLVETNNRLKVRIKQLEATINLCEIKIRESEQSLCKKSNQVIGRDCEIIHLKSDQSHMQDELKKLQLQNKLMNNELNQTLIKSPVRMAGGNCEENLNKFITFKQHPTEPRRSYSTSNLNVSKHQRLVKKINVINK